MRPAFNIHILGASAATPTSLRHTTAQLVHCHNKYYLLDCAEGTQMQLRKMKMPLMKINHIFISHLHGDHYLGLPGLLFTLHLLGRKQKLHIYSPAGLKEIIDLQYEITQLTPSFPIDFHVIDKGKKMIFENNDITVETIEMWHQLPAYGFLIKEKPGLKNIRKDAIDKYGISVPDIQRIKAGKDLRLDSGQVIPNVELTFPPTPPRSYAFCSDTGYTENFLDQIKGVDLLYHEATFLHDKKEIAREKTHSTAIEAATLARKAQVKQLMLGHYSARYDDNIVFSQEAKTVFENTILADEGMRVEILPNGTNVVQQAD